MSDGLAPSRLLWLTKGLGRGGAERLIVDAATLVDRERFHIEVAYLLPHKDALVPELTAVDVPVHCLGQMSQYDMRWVPRLRRLVREGGFSLLHTHAPVPAIAARIGLGRPRPRLVHTEHNVWERYRWPTFWANALTYHHNDHVVAVSAGVASSVDLRRVGARSGDVEVLHHGIKLSTTGRFGGRMREHARAELRLPQDAAVIGTVGNLTPKKDQDCLLRAFRTVLDRMPEARLVIVGGGVLERHLRRKAVELGIERETTFTGSRSDVEALLPGFDVFAMTSRYEGLSIALVEALAAGLPAVVTPVGGVVEVVRDGQEGFYAPVGDARRVADRLLTLLQDTELRKRMGEAAIERSHEFDMSSAVRRLEDIYEEVLSR
jgi:glycosyltransferase involved in cell wall biosynthesis